ncbi:MAG: hypothetical protein ACOYJG_11065 [Prevotella sp.]|jgi:cytochrome c biogenesis factor
MLQISGLTIFLTTLYFILLGVVWLKGYDIVKKHDISLLPRFYLVLATIRFILTATLVLIYVLVSDNMASSRQFVILVMTLYAAMMVITLTLKH